jgi:hypothetical protein
VMEDWPVGGVVTQVIARDEDLGMAGRVRYSLLETGAGEEDFVLDEVSGVLRVKKQLDYETTSIYNLTVRAKDMGTPALSSDTFIVLCENLCWRKKYKSVKQKFRTNLLLMSLNFM